MAGKGREGEREYVYSVTSWNEYEGLQGFYGVFRNEERAKAKCVEEALFARGGVARVGWNAWYWEEGVYQHVEELDRYSYQKIRVE